MSEFQLYDLSDTSPTGKKSFSSKSFLRGMRKALPIVLGYFPVGFAFGVMATNAGMGVFEAGLMGLLVFAGSGQLIATGMMIDGAGIISIVVTTFVVNLRHLLMSAAVSPYLKKWNKSSQAWYAYQMTDETFSLDIGTFAESGVDRNEVLGAHATAHTAWVTSGIIGAIFGDIIGDLRPYGLDYALAGMFIAILAPHLRIPRRLLAAILAASLSIIFALSLSARWNVIMATVIAATFGVLLPARLDRPKNQGRG